ncbi:hypothetical protein BT96DRAFT_1040004 [Gymnopus androsaceus JB14]|uniref:RNase H type-1 domain-containing protein n=1 Tax=Gymnopus androsaceus JB14 TaxID=1447944 RepID=A0A6A4HFH7_9AGAR|nr:hypothetical protein BT96DRAFT_1040004 [Gymnopus androsaceus JB14]
MHTCRIHGGGNDGLLKATMASLRKWKTITNLHWVKGHAGIDGNEKADELANEGTRHCEHRGAKLSNVTQQKKMKTKAYQKALDHWATNMGIGRAKASAVKICGKTPSDGAVWKSMHHRDISRKIRNFLWMTAHSGYKVGEYWETIPTYENRAPCRNCGVTENMDHILFECQAPGQKEIWELAEKLWENKVSPWIKPHLGIILSCGLTNFKDENENHLPGDSRLYRILVSECKWVINEKDPPSANEIWNRWLWTIESRLKLDRLLTSSKFDKKKLSKKVVSDTWKEVVSIRVMFLNRK